MVFGGCTFTEWVVGAQRATGRCGGADGTARLLVISAAEMRVEASVFRGVRVGDWIDQVGLRLEAEVRSASLYHVSQPFWGDEVSLPPSSWLRLSPSPDQCYVDMTRRLRVTLMLTGE